MSVKRKEVENVKKSIEPLERCQTKSKLKRKKKNKKKYTRIEGEGRKGSR